MKNGVKLIEDIWKEAAKNEVGTWWWPGGVGHVLRS